MSTESSLRDDASREESDCNDCDGCSRCCHEDVDNYCDDEEVGGSVSQKEYDATCDALKSRGFEYVGAGMFRAVFMRGGVVVKVPHNKDGYIDNRTEAAAWRKYRNKPTSRGAYVAPCRLLDDGCLMMVSVDSDNINYANLPAWARQIDCSQVGMYKGRMVAYDFALDVMEREEWEKEWGTFSKFFHENRLDFLKKKSV
jgi:hypothetical protein